MALSIKLVNGGVVWVDAADEVLVAPYRWQRFDSKKQQYAVTWVTTSRGWRPILMHRFILDLPERLPYVDHIDGDGLNNRRSNLRLVTNSQNLQNRHGLCRLNTSGYRNVYWDKSRQKWMVLLTIRRKSIHLGRYDNIEEANQIAIEGRRTYMTHASEER